MNNKQNETIETDTIGTNHRAEQLAILTALLASGHYTKQCHEDRGDFYGGTVIYKERAAAVIEALAIHRDFDDLTIAATATAATSTSTQDDH